MAEQSTNMNAPHVSYGTSKSEPLKDLLAFAEGTGEAGARESIKNMLEQAPAEGEEAKAAKKKVKTALTNIEKLLTSAREQYDSITAALDTGKGAGGLRKLKEDFENSVLDVLSAELEARSHVLAEFLEKAGKEAAENINRASEEKKKVEENLHQKLLDIGFEQNNVPPLAGTAYFSHGFQVKQSWEHPEFRAAEAAERRASYVSNQVHRYSLNNEAAIELLKSKLESLMNNQIS